jgi:hypothetical protein
MSDLLRDPYMVFGSVHRIRYAMLREGMLDLTPGPSFAPN